MTSAPAAYPAHKGRVNLAPALLLCPLPQTHEYQPGASSVKVIGKYNENAQWGTS